MTLHCSCLKSSMRSSTRLKLHVSLELQTIGSISRLIFRLPMHARCHFKPLLLLHRNYPIDLQNISMGWFLYNDNTTNFKHHFFHILFSISFTPLAIAKPSKGYFTKTCQAYFTKTLH